MLALTKALRFGASGVARDAAEGPVLPRPLRRPARFLGRWFSGNVEVPRHAVAVANGGMLAVALLYGAIAGGHMPVVVQASSSAVGFALRDLSISGHKETSEIEIAGALGLDGWTSLIGYDAGAARARLESLPWIAGAAVRKVYPAGLAIDVTERQATAIWQHDDELTLIDGTGKPIAEFADPRFAGLPLVIGTGANAAVGELLPALASQPDIASRVKAHIRIGERRWDLRLDNGVTVRLPETGIEDAMAELARLEQENGVLERDIAAIDLRLADRVAFELTPKGAEVRAQAVKDAIIAEKKARRT